MKHCPQCSTGYPDTLAACPTHGLPLNEIRDLKPGMVVHHSYRIVRKLGQGGMGAVYLAQHTLMDEPRALKFLSAELSQDAAFTARFLREVRTLRQIRHCNVVDCGDLESAEDGSLFFSMEFVDGPDLRAFLRNFHSDQSAEPWVPPVPILGPGIPRSSTSGFVDEPAVLKGHDFSRAANDPKVAPALAAEGSFSSTSPKSPGFSATSFGALPIPLALDLTRQIAAGLAAAHARGMVHRDIKPENILLARDAAGWQPKIADFGIVATKEASTAFTRTGGTLLTVAYAAPEQWRGTPAAQLDGRTDLYALGGLLYEMLTGQTPFHAESYEGWAQAHQTTPPPPPSALRPDLANWQGLDALVQRLLAKDREDRPKDVAELLGLIDAVRLIPSKKQRKTVKEVIGKSADLKHSKRVPIWGWAASVTVLLIAVFIAGRIFGPQPSKLPQETSAQRTPTAQPQPAEAEPKSEQDISLKPSDTKSIAQQEQGPKPVTVPSATPTATTLLVMCDLDCNWKLDGEVKGHINANGSMKVKIEPGQHVVIAMTEDNADQVRQFSEIKANSQTVVSIELKSVRDGRLNAEQEIRDKADREARDKAVREQAAREAQEKAVREQHEREQRKREEAAGLTWTDTATGLMWTKKGQGKLNWKKATAYCQNLQLAGHADWRLPVIEELKGIYDRGDVKGNLQVPKGAEWSSSQGDDPVGIFIFYFDDGVSFSTRTGFWGDGGNAGALCVRRSGE